jgi:hypothetical protein
MSFDYLNRLQPELSKTARYTLSMISTDNGETNPVLIVRPATDVNKPYTNEQMKMARRNAAAMRAGGATLAMLEANRDNDRELFAKYVVTDWEHIVEDDGKVLKFSVDACTDFLKSLPNWIFDDLRSFCGSSSNFVDAVVNVEGIVKN